MTRALEILAINRLHFLAPVFRTIHVWNEKFLAPKINMAESDVDDGFVIKLKQENTLKRKQLLSTIISHHFTHVHATFWLGKLEQNSVLTAAGI